MTTPVLLDCDPGHDDAIALLVALGSPELDLLGVTTVAGNAGLANTTANALRLLEHVGRDDVPVAAGAERPLVREPHLPVEYHGESGLDGPDLPPPRGTPVAAHAVDFLAERVAAAGAPVTLVATGPLTNVALLLARHPAAADGLERVVLMGGAIGLGNTTPAAEYNIWQDPEAARRVFESGLDVTVVPLEVTHLALATPALVERVRGLGRAGRLVAELVDFYGRAHVRMAGAPLHDVVAVMQVIRPDLVTLRRCRVDVECQSDLCRGRTVVDRNGVTRRPANAAVGVDLDVPAFEALLVERLAALPGT